MRLNNSNDDDNTEVIKVCDGSFVLPKESFIKKDEKKSSLITSTINDIILSNNNNNITINNDTNKVDNSLLSYNNLSRSAEYSTILTELTVDEPIGSSRLSSTFIPHSLNSLTSPSPGPLPDNMDRINVSASFISTKGIFVYESNNKSFDLNDDNFDLKNGKKGVIEKLNQTVNTDGTPNINIKLNI
ncbi:16842_t:CDS:2 [Entrophospora sp. SA101]|nr:16842_t:CDS:2 [Entrophospora sp. SA101]